MTMRHRLGANFRNNVAHDLIGIEALGADFACMSGGGLWR